MKNFSIYYTEYTPEGAEYIIKNSDFKKYNVNVTAQRLTTAEISGRMVGSTSPKLLSVLSLDKPDYIITDADNRDEPILTIEFTTQAPVGQNEMQRYARAAASVINEVPSAFVFAANKFIRHRDGSWHHRTAHKIYLASAKASKIYNTPVLTFDWPFEKKQYQNGQGGLIINSKTGMPPKPSVNFPEIKNLFEYINIVLQHYINDTRSQLMDELFIRKRINLMESKCPLGYVRIGGTPGFESAAKIKSADFANALCGKKAFSKINSIFKGIDFYNTNQKLSKLIAQLPLELRNFWTRDEIIVVSTTADPLANNRGYGDPFSGTLAAVDFIHCHQTDQYPFINRRRNLVMLFNHKSAEKYYKKFLRIPTKYNKLKSIEEIKNITTTIFTSNIAFQLSKSIKTFFNLADLIILPKNLYIGRPQI